MGTANLSPIEEWWAAFEKNSLEALDQLLCRRIFMGYLNPNETDEILYRLFHNKDNRMRHRLDEAMRQWFETYWGKTPGSMSSSRWAGELQNAFIAASRLNLGESLRFLRDSYIDDRSWIRSLYIAPSRDPEGWLLRALAHNQEDRRLLPIWMRLCRLEEDIPIDYAFIGLLGLRKLPDKNGEPPGDIPNAFFKAAVCLAEAMDERKKPGYKEDWLREMRVVVALYPRSKQYWAEHFSPFLHYRPESSPAQWLDKVVPKLSASYKRKSNLYLEPPSKQELDKILKIVKDNPLKDIRFELDSFFDKHRAYAYQTGDSYSLVRVFSNIGYKIFRQDVTNALRLIEEAFAWEPYNPFLWSERALIEAFRGNFSRAEGLLWEAKRRFPEDPHIRNELAELFVRQRRYEIAEALYRQTKEDFPKDAVCRNGLAEVLKSLGKLGEAENEYRQTKEAFPRDAVCRTGLAEVLKRLGKLDEAENEYRQTKEAFPGDVVCRTGLAVVLVKQGQEDEAIAQLRETVEKFPGDKVAKGFLGKITSGETISEQDEKILEKEAQVLAQSDKIKPVQLEEPAEYILPPTAKRIADVAQIEYGTDPDTKIEKEKDTSKLETEIGKLYLDHWQSRRAEDNEKYRTKLSTNLQKILEKASRNIPALLIKGIRLADENSQQAQDFLAQEAASFPNTLGFQLLALRVKGFVTKKIDNEEWNRLSQRFPGRSTVIKLEHTMYEMNQGNGSRIRELEQLRKQTLKQPSRLPLTLQKNDQWVTSSIKHRLFQDIDTSQPVTGQSFDTLERNFRVNEPVLKDIVEQCIGSAI